MIQGAPYTLVVNLGATGILDTDVTLNVKKPESLVFEEILLDTSNFQETVDNYYNITIPLEIADQLGTYIFKVEESVGPSTQYLDRECFPQPLSSTPSPGVCVVNGNIRDVTGIAKSYNNTVITAQPLKLPLEVSGSLILGSKVKTYADHDGYFSLPLVIGMTVIIEVPDAGVRFQAVIPDQATVRIEDIIP
jgi:hypothetical protein